MAESKPIYSAKILHINSKIKLKTMNICKNSILCFNMKYKPI